MSPMMKIAIGVACQITANFPATNTPQQIATIQDKCNAYYASCMKDQSTKLGDDFDEEKAADQCAIDKVMK